MRKKPISSVVPIEWMPVILDCDGRKVNSHKISDRDYKAALELGLSIMLKLGVLSYDRVKADDQS